MIKGQERFQPVWLHKPGVTGDKIGSEKTVIYPDMVKINLQFCGSNDILNCQLGTGFFDSFNFFKQVRYFQTFSSSSSTTNGWFLGMLWVAGWGGSCGGCCFGGVGASFGREGVFKLTGEGITVSSKVPL